MSAVQRQRGADARRARIERIFERPRVEPYHRGIERELAFREQQRRVDVEQLA